MFIELALCELDEVRKDGGVDAIRRETPANGVACALLESNLLQTSNKIDELRHLLRAWSSP